MASNIGVGIVGASPRRGWAFVSHVPALQSLSAYEIRAVSTSQEGSARQAAAALEVPLAFSDYRDLVARPEVDLVVVSVNVTKHLDVVRAALAAQKHVLCEWPLARNRGEAESIADLAGATRARTFIGLQGRFAPAVRYTRDLVESGWLGRVLGTRIAGVGPDPLWRGVLAPEFEITADAASGNSLLAIPVGHALDMLAFVLGEFRTLTSTLVARRERALRLRDDVEVPFPMKDQIAFSGVLEGGAVASVHYRGGRSTGPDFVWEINGTDGDVTLVAERGYANIAVLELRGSRGDAPMAPMALPPQYQGAQPGLAMPAVNVAALYRQIADDLASGTTVAPDFGVAVRRHRSIERIERANVA